MRKKPAARRNASAETAAREAAEHFRRLGAGSFQPQLRGITGICQINIEGAGAWRAATNDGVLTLAEAQANALPSDIDTVVSCTAENFVRLLRHEGNLNIHSALLQGLVAVSGDVVIAAALLRSTMVESDRFHF
ncbi:MAG TPA: SCP2 sterol-binding domain-containing protein [Ktedonobacterales bacterium]|nr:SCP2 sterol-binding domain-containing protein [Ktedonobacterales bacterium]